MIRLFRLRQRGFLLGLLLGRLNGDGRDIGLGTDERAILKRPHLIFIAQRTFQHHQD